MKKLLSLIMAILIFTCGVFLAGCSSSSLSKSGTKDLVDCLNKTKTANSMEMTSDTTDRGINIKEDIKAEDIKSNMKSKIEMEGFGTKLVMYLVSNNGSYTFYFDGCSGNYTSSPIDDSQKNGMDIKDTLNNYSDVIENNKSMIKETGTNKYELSIPKAKIKEIYSKLIGKDSDISVDKLKVEFIIGDDGYLKNCNVISTFGSKKTEVKTNYFNYNKKFNITIPTV